MKWVHTDGEIRDITVDEIRMRSGGLSPIDTPARRNQVPMRCELEKKMLLHFTDQFWKDHLLAMDRLRHGVSLRGYGQQNPLLEYKREGTEMFMLMCSLRDEAVLTQLLAFTPDMMMPSMNASRQATERILDVASQASKDPNADIPDLPIHSSSASGCGTPPALPTKGAEARCLPLEMAWTLLHVHVVGSEVQSVAARQM